VRYLESFPSNESGSHFTLRAWFGNVLVEREVMLKAVPIKTEPVSLYSRLAGVRFPALSNVQRKPFCIAWDSGSCRLEIEGTTRHREASPELSSMQFWVIALRRKAFTISSSVSNPLLKL